MAVLTSFYSPTATPWSRRTAHVLVGVPDQLLYNMSDDKASTAVTTTITSKRCIAAIGDELTPRSVHGPHLQSKRRVGAWHRRVPKNIQGSRCTCWFPQPLRRSPEFLSPSLRPKFQAWSRRRLFFITTFPIIMFPEVILTSSAVGALSVNALSVQVAREPGSEFPRSFFTTSYLRFDLGLLPQPKTLRPNPSWMTCSHVRPSPRLKNSMPESFRSY